MEGNSIDDDPARLIVREKLIKGAHVVDYTPQSSRISSLDSGMGRQPRVLVANAARLQSRRPGTEWVRDLTPSTPTLPLRN